jgi:hypothetical protein
MDEVVRIAPLESEAQQLELALRFSTSVGSMLV